MPFELRAVDRSKIYTSIVDQIVAGIRSGAFKPGEALPPERLLAEQFSVSRTSVREAIRVLEHAGVVSVRTGSGTFVTDQGLSIPTLLRTRTALQGDQSPLDVVVARRALEPVCAEQAALSRREHDLNTLRRLQAEHERIVEGDGDPRQVDIDFHSAVAAASHNPVLELLIEQITVILRQPTWQAFTDRSRNKPGRTLVNVGHHQAILEAIVRGDPGLARAAMTAHVADVEASALVEAGEVNGETV